MAILSTGDEEERYFKNPAYGDTSITQLYVPSPGTTYDTVNLPTQTATEKGRTYDVLDRGQAKGKHISKGWLVICIWEM